MIEVARFAVPKYILQHCSYDWIAEPEGSAARRWKRSGQTPCHKHNSIVGDPVREAATVKGHVLPKAGKPQMTMVCPTPYSVFSLQILNGLFETNTLTTHK